MAMLTLDTPARAAMVMMKSDGEKQQEYLRGLVDAEPEDDQRDERQRRNRPHELDDRVEEPAHNRGQPHGEAERHADERAEEHARQHPVDADPDVLPERHVAESLGREPYQPVPGRADRRPVEGLDPAEGRGRATRAAAARRRCRIDQIRPGSTALASPNRTVFCRANGLSASPSQTSSAHGCPRRSSPAPSPMICSSMLQIIDSISSRIRDEAPGALTARALAAQRLARRRAGGTPARSAPAAAPSRSAARRETAPPRPSG